MKTRSKSIFNIFMLLALLVLLFNGTALLVGAMPLQADSTTVTYSPTTAIITNPERGFLHTNASCDSDLYDLAALQNYRTSENISLVLCNFYLASFKTSPISQAALDTLQTQLNTIRSAGLKVVLRFAYTDTNNVDASLAQILAHIDQLAPIIQSNSDVILVWQAGFIGEWGEWFYTSHFGDEGNISAQQWADRKAVVDKMLQVLPSTRMVSLRTPLFKRTMYQTAAITPGQSFNGSAIARIGQFNDAFVASPDDLGTYTDPSVEYPWLEAETAYLPMGGENDEWAPPRTNCATALEEMGMFHWSYINTDYLATTITNWNSQGCLVTMKKNLGYRFVLTQGTYPNSVQAGSGLELNISIKNEGFATPFNPRPCELILRDTSTGTLYRFPLAGDPRRWTAGTTVTLNETITLSTDIPVGSYELLLNLPDADGNLSVRPEYSIQMANSDVWEPGTGFNNLLNTMTITPAIPSIFTDVPSTYWAWNYIERLYNAGITGGCSTSPLMYCPEATVTRAQMAIFILRGIHGSAYAPPAATGTVFTDVPLGSFAADWIEQLATEGVTSGCGGGNYCPDATVTRAQMAIFLLRGEHGSSYTPPAATGAVFGDVPLGSFAVDWIEQLALEGITSGCGGGNYCPDNSVTRAEMAVFLVRAFSLP